MIDTAQLGQLKSYPSALNLLPYVYPKPSTIDQFQNGFIIPTRSPKYTIIEPLIESKIPVESALFKNKNNDIKDLILSKKSDLNQSDKVLMLPNGEMISQTNVLVQIESEKDPNYRAFMSLSDLLKRYYALDRVYKYLKIENESLINQIQEIALQHDSNNLTNNDTYSNKFDLTPNEQTIKNPVPSSAVKTIALIETPKSANFCFENKESTAESKQHERTPSDPQSYKNYFLRNSDIGDLKEIVNGSRNYVTAKDLATLLKLKDQLLPSLYQPYNYNRKIKTFKKLIVKKSLKPMASNSSPSYLKPTASSLKMARKTTNNKLTSV